VKLSYQTIRAEGAIMKTVSLSFKELYSVTQRKANNTENTYLLQKRSKLRKSIAIVENK
jgi:hypothetical protein